MMDFLIKPVYAQGVNTKANLPGFISFMSAGGDTAVSRVWGWFISIIFVFAALFVFFHLVMGALKWIQSGGEKEKVEKARQEITTAVVGLVILFLVFLLIVIIELVFGIGLGITAPIRLPKFGDSI